MDADVGIVVRNVKNAVFAKFPAPAVLADKSAILLRGSGKIILRVGIVPSNDDNIMVGLFRSLIAVGIRL